jgi:catechol 2,3-dioxygenase-like lactoylglutathione lyase family enzyme
MTIAGLHYVTLLVDDVDKAAWFYGGVLEMAANPRPDFDFPGLFYRCGEQQIHLIVTPQLPPVGDLALRFDDGSMGSRRYIHRHAALIAPDLPALQQRLQANNIEILIDPEHVDAEDALTHNLLAAWMRMYGQVPLFCLDPFGNLLELVPGRAG